MSSHYPVTISWLLAEFAAFPGPAVIIYDMHILVTGASGFAGSQLIPRLRSDGHLVRALARDPARVDLAAITSASSGDPLSLITGDVLTGEGLATALAGIEVAYYLIHSMERSSASAHAEGTSRRATPLFPERERRAAENFATAAAAAGVRRIVYLGGPTASWTTATAAATTTTSVLAGRGAAGRTSRRDATIALSPHLRSREAVERILRAGVPDTVALRASIVIGARSRSLRFMVRLVERMPVLALPSWRSYRTRPIDARDVIDMLAGAATVSNVAGSSLDIGGPDILSYGEMIQRIAELMLLGRPVLGLGVSATPFTARIAAAIAEEDPELVGALMESLQGDLLPGGEGGDSHLRAAELLGVELHSFDAAVECALREWEAVEPLAAR
jgi:uncharacterized protein YbjT (DUF2867 family)